LSTEKIQNRLEPLAKFNKTVTPANPRIGSGAGAADPRSLKNLDSGLKTKTRNDDKRILRIKDFYKRLG
jgi:hypothetical protein